MNWNLKNKIPLTEFLTSKDDKNFNYLEKLLRDSASKKIIEDGLIDLMECEDIYLIAERNQSFTLFGTRGYMFSGFTDTPVQECLVKKARKIKFPHLPAVLTVGGQLKHGNEVHRAYWPPETITVFHEKPIEELKIRIGHQYFPIPTAWIIHDFRDTEHEGQLLSSYPQAKLTVQTEQGIDTIVIEQGDPGWNIIARPSYEVWEVLKIERDSTAQTDKELVPSNSDSTSNNSEPTSSNKMKEADLFDIKLGNLDMLE